MSNIAPKPLPIPFTDPESLRYIHHGVGEKVSMVTVAGDVHTLQGEFTTEQAVYRVEVESATRPRGALSFEVCRWHGGEGWSRFASMQAASVVRAAKSVHIVINGGAVETSG